MNNNLIINGLRYLITCNPEDEILVNVTLVIRDGLISEINPRSLPADLAKFDIIDGSEKLLMPGLINTHTHLPMVLLRGWAEGVNLQQFLEKVWIAEGAIMDADSCALGAELGAGEALLSGTTTVLDMYFHAAATHKAAKEAGLRHIGGPILFDFPAVDGLEWNDRLNLARTWPAMLSEIGGPFTPIFLMPHSVYTDSLEHLREVAALGKELNARIHLHVSETETENVISLERFSKTPTEVIRDTGILDLPTTYGHGVHLSDSDLEISLRYGASVAHCPGSNLKLGSGILDLKKYQDAGLVVGLGTDGCSSSNDLDMWAVIRLAAQMVSLSHTPAEVDLRRIIRAATIDGATAVGMEDRIGSIEIGKEADLLMLDLTSLHLIPIHNVLATLVFTAGRGDVTDVWVRGERVVNDRKLVKVDSIVLKIRVEERMKALDPFR